jgi:hypothetical protein
MSKSFTPWVRDFKLGTCFLLPGLVMGYISLRGPNPDIQMLLLSIPFMTLGGYMIKNGFVRWNGKQIEQGAIRSIKWPEGWSAQANKPLPSGGDVDLLVEGPEGERFAIEIKSTSDVTVKMPFLGIGTPKLKTHDGRKLRDDPVNQAIQAAQAVAATPVLWFPKAKPKTVKIGELTVVLGNKKRLLKAMDVPLGWTWW